MTIKTKLLVGLLVLVGLTVLVGGFSLYKASRLGELTVKLYDHPLTVSRAALQANLAVIKMHRGMNTQIAKAAEEQMLVAEEMNHNLVNINQVAEHTATGAQQTRASSSSMIELASHLQGLVQQFRV